MKNNELLSCSIINLDKPVGPTSHQVSSWVAGLLGVKKAGHAGTLDPAVSGVLPIGIGKATRLCHYLLKSDKEYVGVMWLHDRIPIKKIRDVIKKSFIGKVKQLPPVRAAVARKLRQRRIYDFKILEKKGKAVLFRVACEAGTYIRKLVHDLGAELGVGAHMVELRRVSDGIFDEAESITLYELISAIKSKKLSKVLLPPEIIIKDMPRIVVKDSASERLGHGAPVFRQFVLRAGKFKSGDYVAVLSKRGKLIEVAQAVKAKEAVAKPETVLI